MNGETRFCLEDAVSDSNVADFNQKDSSEIGKDKKKTQLQRGIKKLYFLNFCLSSFDPQTEANKSIH